MATTRPVGGTCKPRSGFGVRGPQERAQGADPRRRELSDARRDRGPVGTLNRSGRCAPWRNSGGAPWQRVPELRLVLGVQRGADDRGPCCSARRGSTADGVVGRSSTGSLGALAGQPASGDEPHHCGRGGCRSHSRCPTGSGRNEPGTATPTRHWRIRAECSGASHGQGSCPVAGAGRPR
jgi:hypothetical protein